MNQVEKFFEDRHFSFGSAERDIKPKTLIIPENSTLTKKLERDVYVYESPEQTNTSFYLISTELTAEELYEVRKHIWNEDRFDLYFTVENIENSFITNLFYAKTNPKDQADDFKIDRFAGDETDSKKLEKIDKWQFDSGKFWLSYSDFLKKIEKSTRVDEKLIDTLKQLKTKLSCEFEKKHILNSAKIVQALIDRTLFIKFLEDNHIINSYFYRHYFGKENLNYKSFLAGNDKKNINELFKRINEIFNNVLFEVPIIDEKILDETVCSLIHDMISQKDWKTGQLSLFDFHFDVIPIEFISHIYEVFLEDRQREEGIYYTPKKLAQLIIDDILVKPGTILDPACGSGMFLVIAFRQIMSFLPAKSNDASGIIEHRNKLLNDFIFGIEKDETARRLAVFSLYLELFREIEPEKIKEYIENKLKSGHSTQLFPYDFSGNITLANSLEVRGEAPHKKKKFDYIVGNPPYFKIKNQDEEMSFIDNYELKIGDTLINAKDVIGNEQISQCFILKIKDWAKERTTFGFVINSSNFYNENSKKFRKFFFRFYQLERLYELTRVTEILFKKSKENVNVLIFNNREINDNSFQYYPVEMGIFSKYFNLLIIKDDKSFPVKQRDVLDEKLRLRDYLIGNEFDRKLVNKLKNGNAALKEFILDDKYYGLARGMEITGKKVVCKSKGISKNEYDEYPKQKRDQLLKEFKESHSSAKRTNEYQVPFIKKSCLDSFRILNYDCYLNEDDLNNEIFRRYKKMDFFKGNRILYSYITKKINNTCFSFGHYIKGTASPADDVTKRNSSQEKSLHENKISTNNNIEDETICIASDLLSIRLKDEDDYFIITALLNSYVVNYFLNIDEIIRPKGTYPRLNMSTIKRIPVCSLDDAETCSEISAISRELTAGKYLYTGKIKEKLNELIFDLYDLSFLERARIKDFFSGKEDVDEPAMDAYKQSLRYTLEIYFERPPAVEYYIGKNLPFGLVVTAVYLNKAREEQPTGKKTLQYIVNEILAENPEEKFLAMREKIYGKNCIYIVKDSRYQNWTITKAYEDGQEILEKLRT